MGQHHRRDDHVVTAGRPVALRVPSDAPPAGLGYPPPIAYRPHPVTGVPTPPRMVRLPASERPERARLRHRFPVAVAVVGASVAVVGAAAQVPALTTGLAAGGPAPPRPSTTPTTAQQCATVVADAVDFTVATLGRTAEDGWTAVIDDRGNALADTYGTGSPEHRAYVQGVDDVVAWLHADADGPAEDYSQVTVRVARGVASTCGWTG